MKAYPTYRAPARDPLASVMDELVRQDREERLQLHTLRIRSTSGWDRPDPDEPPHRADPLHPAQAPPTRPALSRSTPRSST